MSRSVKIPNNTSPDWSCTINGITYTYKAGTTQTVPDAVASLIENNARLKPTEADPEPVNTGLKLYKHYIEMPYEVEGETLSNYYTCISKESESMAGKDYDDIAKFFRRCIKVYMGNADDEGSENYYEVILSYVDEFVLWTSYVDITGEILSDSSSYEAVCTSDTVVDY